MPDRQLGVQHRAAGAEDGHGELVVGAPGGLLGPWPGRGHERGDGSWLLSVDPAAWPLAADDLVVDSDAGLEWSVLEAERMQSSVDPGIDFIRATGRLRVGGGTEPAEAGRRFTHQP